MAVYKGGCACGRVRYDITADPIRMVNCHCRDCQRASGSAFGAVMIFPADSATLIGEIRYFAVTSDSGNRMSRGFCPNCGSPIVATLAKPELILIQAASLDDPAQFRPSANIWMRSAVPWDHVDPAIPSFDTRAI